jgi:hypothetical protein
MAVSAGPDIIEDGLVLCLDAGNRRSYPGSGTAWRDLSGNGNTGTLTNGPTYSSVRGGSIVFDGFDDYVSFASTTVGEFANANFSYGAWFYYSGVAQSSVIIAKRNDSPWNQYSLAIYNDATNGGNGTKLTAFMNPDPSTPGHGAYAAFNYELGNNSGWYFAVITNNYTQQKMYVNGVQVLTVNASHDGGTFLMTGNPLYVGAVNLNATPSVYFNSSYIPVAFLYNRALTATQVSQNFNALRGRFGL